MLSLILSAIKEKGKPFLYLDSHAGAGRYMLSGEKAERTGEFLKGITRIWQRDDVPTLLALYLDVVPHFNRTGQLCYYPGSPLLARQLLRDEDKLHLTELHASGYPLLRSEFHKDALATVLRADVYQQLKSQLPWASRRGVVLIDPPDEMNGLSGGDQPHSGRLKAFRHRRLRAMVSGCAAPAT